MSYKEQAEHFIRVVFELMDHAKTRSRIGWSSRLEEPLDNKYWLIVTDGLLGVYEKPRKDHYIACAWVKRHSDKWNIGQLLDKYLTLLDEEES